ncbi:MAG: adenosylmethionine--8-amino-7-oxononanoate transaminase [Holosporales bacterium]
MSLSTRDEKSIWHPFTQHHTSAPPLPIARAEGAYLYTQSGERLLDCISSWWTCLHGHCHPDIVAAIAQQAATLDHVLFAGHTHTPAVELAEGLLSAAPGFGKVFYSDNGSTAVEVALKIALHYWQNIGQPQRTRLAALEHGYHGDTFGAMAAGRGSGFFYSYSAVLPRVDILSPETPAIEAYFQEHGADVAGFLLEPLVQGAGGMRMYAPSIVDAWCAAARKAGALVLMDEVMTGFGRTGTLFAHQQLSHTPDVLCLSKGITGGMLPLSVTMTTEAVFQAFLGESFSRALAHGHSYTANPIACAAALASLRLFESGAPQRGMATIAATHTRCLPLLCAAVPGLTNPRQTGTIAAVDLPGDAVYGGAQSQAVRLACYKAGLLLRPMGKVLYFMPPYCVTSAELEQAYTTLAEILPAALTGGTDGR